MERNRRADARIPTNQRIERIIEKYGGTEQLAADLVALSRARCHFVRCHPIKAAAHSGWPSKAATDFTAAKWLAAEPSRDEKHTPKETPDAPNLIAAIPSSLGCFVVDVDEGGTPAAIAVLRKLGVREAALVETCLLYTSPSPRDRQKSRMPSSA